MSNDLTQQQYDSFDDGWSDAAEEASERMIRGELLRFIDWRYTAGRESTPVAIGTQLVALATSAAWIRWEGGKPVEPLVRRPGERLVPREDLGFTDESKWETGPSGERKDPWANTRMVYFVHPESAEAYTFSTSSWGGRSAVIELGDTIARMRSSHPTAVPIVELQAREMPTKFGKKSKPHFKIVGWKNASGATEQKPQGPRPVITSGKPKAVEAPPPVERYEGPIDRDDPIPF